MNRIGAHLLAVCMLGLSACSRESAGLEPCPPDLGAYARLENRARPDDPLGVTARSALDYLAREKLPTTGYYMSKKPLASDGDKVEYDLRHESGFDKPCVAGGNPSGFDGVLEIDPATRQVKRFVRR